jgi:hypothetical protein
VAERQPASKTTNRARRTSTLCSREFATAGAPYVELPETCGARSLPWRPCRDPTAADRALREAYGENNVGLRNIQLASGSGHVRGNAIPTGHQV